MAARRKHPGLDTIRACAWDCAGQYVGFMRKWGGDEFGIARDSHGEARGYLSALYFLDETPGGQQYDIDSLIGVRAWVMGEAPMPETYSDRLPRLLAAPSEQASA